MLRGLFFKARIYASHAYAVTMWSAAPLVVFILVGMVLYRILDSPAYVLPALILVAVIHFWVFLRLLKGMSIVYDVLPLKMYAAGIIVALCVFAVVYVYYDATASAPMYFSYMYHMMTNSFVDGTGPCRMYLSKLEIIGFKSFAQKVNLAFDSGISAIVGPNGCGKTNIVDAIRWVLGEQRYSALRSDKMEDVIFNGTKARKALGMAEASLVIENTKGILPSEYTQVTIGRRVYRSGESEYLLNKTPCRLKDILDLFMDTGMGADAYSVIELKMIETILSDKTDERRRLFEEAAGVTKYKHRRKAAYRKLESVQADLRPRERYRRGGPEGGQLAGAPGPAGRAVQRGAHPAPDARDRSDGAGIRPVDLADRAADREAGVVDPRQIAHRCGPLPGRTGAGGAPHAAPGMRKACGGSAARREPAPGEDQPGGTGDHGRGRAHPGATAPTCSASSRNRWT